MRVFYLVNMNQNNIKGLFTANHGKLKALKKIIGKDDIIDVLSVQYQDEGILKIIKKLMGKKVFVNNGESFIYDGLKYKKEYLGINLKFKSIEKSGKDEILYDKIIEKYEDEIKKADFVVAQWGYPHGRLAYYIHKKFNKPYIVQYYGSDIHTNPKKNPHLVPYMKEILDEASLNIFVSDKLRRQANELGWNKDNYVITHNGISLDDFNKLDEEKVEETKKLLGIENEKVIGYVGSLNHVKRSDSLAKIFKNIEKKRHSKYLIVGDGELRNQIEKEAKEYKIDIHITGNVDLKEVNKYMNIMDVLVIPSRNEGFGSVVVEANSLGVLAIGSDSGGIPETIGNDEYIVKDGENFEERFAEKILHYLDVEWDKDILRQRVIEEYTWETIAKYDLSKILGAIYNGKTGKDN